MSYVINSTVKAQLETLADKAAAVYSKSEKGWSPILKEFKALAADLGVTDRKSEGGKAIDAIMGSRVEAALAKSGDYDLRVHQVTAGSDEYLPVDEAHPANFTITGAYAVSANLTDLNGVKDKPRGMKAWLRGNAENGLRPDGETGLRDLIKNGKDQVLSRFWKKKRTGGAGAAALDQKLLDLYKSLKGARDRWETDGGECLTDAEFKIACDLFADKVLKRSVKAARKS